MATAALRVQLHVDIRVHAVGHQSVHVPVRILRPLVVSATRARRGVDEVVLDLAEVSERVCHAVGLQHLGRNARPGNREEADARARRVPGTLLEIAHDLASLWCLTDFSARAAMSWAARTATCWLTAESRSCSRM